MPLEIEEQDEGSRKSSNSGHSSQVSTVPLEIEKQDEGRRKSSDSGHFFEVSTLPLEPGSRMRAAANPPIADIPPR